MKMAVQIGELRARLVAEATQMKEEVKAVKKGIADLGEDAKKTSKSFGDMNAAMAKVAANTDHLKAIEQHLKKIDPAKVEQGLSAVVDELRKMGAEQKQIAALERALEDMAKTAKTSDIRVSELEKELKKLKEQLEKTKDETDKTTGGFSALASGIAALGAGATLSKLVSMTQTLANEANQLASSYRGLTVVADSFNVKSDEAVKLADKLADRWGLNKGTLADTVKTYLTMNLTLEDTEKIITATADAAAYNRQAHLSWDEAIKQVAEGIKAGNSNLTDAAGITTNLSVMQEKYAKSIGTTAAKLTDAQKVQAAYNGMLAEGAIFAGNADDAMTGYTGTQAAFQSTLQEVRTELGEAFIPVLERVLELITPLIKGFATWTEENKETVAGLTAAAVAVTALIAVVGALTAAFLALNSVMGPVGWTLMGIGALVAGVTAYEAASNAAADSVLKFARNQDELNKKLSESPLKRSAEEVKVLKSDLKAINDLMEKRSALEEKMASRPVSAQTRGMTPELAELQKTYKELKKIDEELAKFGIDTPEKAPAVIEKMTKHLNQAVPAMLEMDRAEARATATQIDHTKRMESLLKRYQDLNDIEKLNEAQKRELAGVVDELAKAYPDLIRQVDDEGRWKLKNIDITNELIRAEKLHTEESAKGVRERTNLYKSEVEMKLGMLRAELSGLESKVLPTKGAPFVQGLVADGAFSDLLPEETRRFLAHQSQELYDKTKKRTKELRDEVNQQQLILNEIKKREKEITDGTFFNPTTYAKTPETVEDSKKKGKTPEQLAAELRQQAFQESMALYQFRADMEEWAADQRIAELQRIREKHKKYLAETVQDERMILLELKRLNEQHGAEIAENKKAEYENSLDWIEREKYFKRLSLEEELAAWLRVQARYEQGTKERERTEREIFRVEQEMQKEREKWATERQKDISNLNKDAMNAVRELERAELAAIDKKKKAEQDAHRDKLQQIDKEKSDALDALDEQRRAIDEAYRQDVEVLDDHKYADERQKIADELEKYKFAVSKEGRERYRSLEEQLTKLDEQENRRQLQLERDDKVRNLDDQKRTLEKHYEAVKAAREADLKDTMTQLDKQRESVEQYYADVTEAFSETSADIKNVEQLLQDDRLKLLSETNAGMEAELRRYVSEYNKITSAIVPPSISVKAQMEANSFAWGAADAAGRLRLEEENRRLGGSIGAVYDNGTWYKDGKPLYHTVGVAGEMNFRQDDQLMPDEISAILRRSELVFQPAQLDSLLQAVRPDSGGGGVTHVYHAPLAQVQEMHVRDDQDVQMISRDLFHLQESSARSKGGRMR